MNLSGNTFVALAADGRLFGLDPQLLFDAAVTAVNVFILFLLLTFILFNPVRNMLKKRQDKITSDRENAENDKKEREKIDKLNQADSMIFTTENMLKEQGDKLPADVKSEMEAALQKLKDAHKAQDLAAIDAAIAEVNNVAQKMYAAGAGAQAGPQAGPDMGGAGFNGAGAPGGAQQGGSSNAQQDAQDADFEEVK